MTTRERVVAWIDGYERAWRTRGTGSLAELFAADATYLQGPYDAPVVGLPAIERMWEAERDGPDEAFTMSYEIVAVDVDVDVAVARVEVGYGAPVDQEYLDLWLIWFDADGRCRRFEEWPYWPERTTVDPD